MEYFINEVEINYNLKRNEVEIMNADEFFKKVQHLIYKKRLTELEEIIKNNV